MSDAQTAPTRDASPTGGLEVSIVIPVWNERPYLAACLEAILQTDLPADRYEVLVVDGGSTDGSREIAQEYAGRHANVFMLENPERIPSTAMNRGIRRARGRYIVRMDAHAEFPPAYARTCVEELERTGADNVGFPADARASGESVVARAIALFNQHPLGVARHATGGSLAHGEQDPRGIGGQRSSGPEKTGPAGIRWTSPAWL